MFKHGVTLRTQFYSLIIAMTFFAFAGSVLSQIYTFRDYLTQQLSSHAQDAAHSLGLSISSMGLDDAIMIETLARTVFDSGYYKEIQYRNLDGELLIDLQHNPVSTVPSWFKRLFVLTAPVKESEVSNGWVAQGTLTVRSHTGLAEQHLYDQAKHILLIALGMFVLAALAIHFILGAILKPLQLIVAQAQAVGRKEFKQNPVKAGTVDLQQVLKALNQMVSNISQVFTEQSGYAEKLMQEAYLDPLTQLPNRRALNEQLAGIQQEAKQQRSKLYVAMLSLPSLHSLNQKHGYAAGDLYVQEAAKQLKQLQTLIPDLHLFRLSGSEFALLTQGDASLASSINSQLEQALRSGDNDYYPEGFGRFVQVLVTPDEQFSHVLSRLDVLQAQDIMFMLNPSSAPEPAELPKGLNHAQWADLLDNLLSDSADFKQMELLLQPILDQQYELLYAEAMIRFNVPDAALNTAEVISMANLLGRGAMLEKRMLSFMLYALSFVRQGPVAINISLPFLQNDALYQWFFEELKAKQAQLPDLMVELAESVVLKMPARVSEFIQQLKQFKVQLVIERFGANLLSLQHIKDLDIDYVKVDRTFTQALHEQNNRFFLLTLTQICHSVGIKVLASCLENHTNVDVCKELHLDGFQGFAIGYPVNFPIDEKIHDANSSNITYTLKAILALYGDTKHVN
ncbi:bifunctional diguanylate cyclase/phosphodiesterase [Alishewanella sp. d11]|uniref:bifunctional diguanylate cyclase/phosphodiesterase n=1 Tax=Alishewanella sp. d11 TaxID=3414030 RepID=UPI003BF81B0F